MMLLAWGGWTYYRSPARQIRAANGLVQQVNPGEYRVELRGPGWPDYLLKEASRLQHVVELSLPHSLIKSQDLAVLKDFTALKHIDLSWTKIDDSAAEFLLTALALESVRLDGTPFGDAGMKALMKHKNLRRVAVNDTLVTANAVRQADVNLFVEWSDVREFTVNSFASLAQGDHPRLTYMSPQLTQLVNEADSQGSPLHSSSPIEGARGSLDPNVAKTLDGQELLRSEFESQTDELDGRYTRKRSSDKDGDDAKGKKGKSKSRLDSSGSYAGAGGPGFPYGAGLPGMPGGGSSLGVLGYGGGQPGFGQPYAQQPRTPIYRGGLPQLDFDGIVGMEPTVDQGDRVPRRQPSLTERMLEESASRSRPPDFSTPNKFGTSRAPMRSGMPSFRTPGRSGSSGAGDPLFGGSNVSPRGGEKIFPSLRGTSGSTIPSPARPGLPRP
jgi:hypothetical protein